MRRVHFIEVLNDLFSQGHLAEELLQVAHNNCTQLVLRVFVSMDQSINILLVCAPVIKFGHLS